MEIRRVACQGRARDCPRHPIVTPKLVVIDAIGLGGQRVVRMDAIALHPAAIQPPVDVVVAHAAAIFHHHQLGRAGRHVAGDGAVPVGIAADGARLHRRLGRRIERAQPGVLSMRRPYRQF